MVETKLNMNRQCAVIVNKSGTVLYSECGQQIKGNYCYSVLGTDKPTPGTFPLGPLIQNKCQETTDGSVVDDQGGLYDL